MGRVFLYVRQKQLTHKIQAVLEEKGFSVTSCNENEIALKTDTISEYSLLVIEIGDAAERTKNALAGLAELDENSSIPIIFLATGEELEPSVATAAAGVYSPYAVFGEPLDFEKFVASVESAVNG